MRSLWRGATRKIKNAQTHGRKNLLHRPQLYFKSPPSKSHQMRSNQQSWSPQISPLKNTIFLCLFSIFFIIFFPLSLLSLSLYSDPPFSEYLRHDSSFLRLEAKQPQISLTHSLSLSLASSSSSLSLCEPIGNARDGDSRSLRRRRLRSVAATGETIHPIPIDFRFELTIDRVFDSLICFCFFCSLFGPVVGSRVRRALCEPIVEGRARRASLKAQRWCIRRKMSRFIRLSSRPRGSVDDWSWLSKARRCSWYGFGFDRWCFCDFFDYIFLWLLRSFWEF